MLVTHISHCILKKCTDIQLNENVLKIVTSQVVCGSGEVVQFPSFSPCEMLTPELSCNECNYHTL